MDTTKYIRILAAIEFFLLLLYLATINYMESCLPKQLQDYLIIVAERDITTFEVGWLITIAPVFIVYLVSMIGLVFTKVWAKKFYIYSNVGLIILTLFAGPFVLHSLSYILDSIIYVICGITIGLLIFTKSAFTK